MFIFNTDRLLINVTVTQRISTFFSATLAMRFTTRPTTANAEALEQASPEYSLRLVTHQ